MKGVTDRGENVAARLDCFEGPGFLMRDSGVCEPVRESVGEYEREGEVG